MAFPSSSVSVRGSMIVNLACMVVTWLTFAAVSTAGAEPPAGVCMGGSQPAKACKTCETCFYCGHKGRWGDRPDNSGTCLVCQAKREAEAKGKRP
jgi:hypothetical protein